jgi:predicted membrane GTPase involved in stress response
MGPKSKRSISLKTKPFSHRHEHPYAPDRLRPCGTFFIVPGIAVSEGIISGERDRADDAYVDPIREKKLSSERNHGKGDNVLLAGPRLLARPPTPA